MKWLASLNLRITTLLALRIEYAQLGRIATIMRFMRYWTMSTTPTFGRTSA